MSASQASALTAITFQLAAAIEAYEHDVEKMVSHEMDPELYQRVSHHMDQMRMYAASVPRLSVAWVELLIRHFELTHAMWRAQNGHADWQAVRDIREAQRNAAQALRRHCLQILAAPETDS
jgi:hypothetical protein